LSYKLRTTDADVLICEGACVAGSVILGKNVSIWYNAVLRGDNGTIEVGDDCNIQDCCILHAGAKLGKGTSVGHGAIVHACTVGDHVLVGMGSIIMTGAKVGNHCIIGAGSLVTGKMDIPDGSLVYGNPAKVIRPLTGEEREKIYANAEAYFRMSAQYRQGD